VRKSFFFAVVSLGMLAYGRHCLRKAPEMRQAIDNLPEMSCEQLVRDGSGGHRYLVLTDAALTSGRSVGMRDSESGALELYHPIYAAGNAKQPPAVELKLILGVFDETDRRRLRDDRDQRQVHRQTGFSPIVIEVSTTADQLPDWAQEGLAKGYPGIVLSRCRVVTIGLDEPTEAHARHLQWRGLGLTALGVIMLGWCVWQIRVRDRRAAPAADSHSAGAPSRSPAGSAG